jgi:hypothetical protein
MGSCIHVSRGSPKQSVFSHKTRLAVPYTRIRSYVCIHSCIFSYIRIYIRIRDLYPHPDILKPGLHITAA